MPKTPENVCKIYAAMLKAVDKGVGDILAKVREADLEDDTLIFFSDNGGPTAETSSNNLPLRGLKEDRWEGARAFRPRVTEHFIEKAVSSAEWGHRKTSARRCRCVRAAFDPGSTNGYRGT